MGNTPLVQINKLTQDVKSKIFAKVESLNPGGSVKDRIGRYIIDDAEKTGKLKPGGTIVEATSGNTGFGLAIVAAVRGSTQNTPLVLGVVVVAIAAIAGGKAALAVLHPNPAIVPRGLDPA